MKTFIVRFTDGQQIAIEGDDFDNATDEAAYWSIETGGNDIARFSAEFVVGIWEAKAERRLPEAPIMQDLG